MIGDGSGSQKLDLSVPKSSQKNGYLISITSSDATNNLAFIKEEEEEAGGT